MFQLPVLRSGILVIAERDSIIMEKRTPATYKVTDSEDRTGGDSSASVARNANKKRTPATYSIPGIVDSKSEDGEGLQVLVL